MTQIFLSHSIADIAPAKRLRQRLLTARPGDVVWLSSDPAAGPAGGTDWQSWIRRTMQASDVIVFIASESSLSPWCSAELGIARLLDKPILPLHTGSIPVTVNPVVAHLQVAALDQPAGVIARLIDDVVDPRVEARSSVAADFVPYPGLAALTEDQELLLCGRHDETGRIVNDLAGLSIGQGRVVVVSGPSGSGKSSLVRAGVIPALRASGWSITGPTQPRQIRLDGIPTLARGSPSVLVVDQFEELASFTQADRTPVLDWIRDIVDAGTSVIVVTRSEFRTEIGEWIPKPIDHYVPFVTTDDLYEIIRRPAKLVQLDVPERLVDRLVLETGSGAALPLLAYTLHELWVDRDRVQIALRESTLDRYGGVKGVLEQRADEALRAATDGDPAVKPSVLAVLSRLASTEHNPPTRTPIRSASITSEERSWLDRFASAGLVTYRTSYALDDHLGGELGPSGDVVIDVTHEALFAWAPLIAAIDAERHANRLRETVESAAAEWAATGGSDDSLLLAGDRLAEAVALGLDLAPGAPGRLIAASVAGDRNRRIRRALTVGLVALTALTVAVAAFALVQRQEAVGARADAEQAETVAQSVRVAARADQLVPTRRDQAMVTAVAAYRTDQNPETEGALLNALATPVGPLRYFANDDARWATLRMADDGQGVVATPDLRPAFVDLATGNLEAFDVDSLEVAEVRPGRSDRELLIWGRRPPSSWSVGTVTATDLLLVEHDTEISAAALQDGQLIFADVDGRVLAASAIEGGWGDAVVVDVQSAAVTDLAVAGNVVASASRRAIRVQRRTADEWSDAIELLSVASGAGASERVSFRPRTDPPELYAVGSDPTVRRWRIGPEIEELPSPGTDVGIVNSMAFEPSGEVMFTAGREGHLRRWDVVAGAPLGDALPAHRGAVQRVSASSRYDVVTSDNDGRAVLWNLRPFRVIDRDDVVPDQWRNLRLQGFVEGEGPLAAITDDRIVVADGSEWPAPTSARRAWWTADGTVVVESGDPSQLDSGDLTLSTSSRAGTTSISERVDAAAVGPCVAAVATGNDVGRIDIIGVAACGVAEVGDGQSITIARGNIVELAWSEAQDRLLVVHRDNSIDVVMRDGTVALTMPGRHQVVATSAAWLDADTVVVGHDVGADVELIELGPLGEQRGDDEVVEYQGHDDAVWWVADDGRRLATAGQDGRIVLTDIASNTPIGQPLVGAQRAVENDPNALIRGLRWLDAGTLLAIHGNRLVAWDLDPERLAARSCLAAQLELSDSELNSLKVAPPCDPGT